MAEFVAKCITAGEYKVYLKKTELALKITSIRKPLHVDRWNTMTGSYLWAHFLEATFVSWASPTSTNVWQMPETQNRDDPHPNMEFMRDTFPGESRYSICLVRSR